ncbi:MAG: hypothetical protein Q4G13_09990 [Moraxella sp.]|nr:hypothetical protein [Moraxella sp.]
MVYYYIDSESASRLANTLLQKNPTKTPLSESESRFIIDTTYTNSNDTAQLLSAIQHNPQSITDDMIMSMLSSISDPMILDNLSVNDKISTQQILQAHQINTDNPLYDTLQDMKEQAVLQLRDTNE